jgi:hypothetical protein
MMALMGMLKDWKTYGEIKGTLSVRQYSGKEMVTMKEIRIVKQ